MSSAGLYHHNAKAFKEDAYAVFESQFFDRQSFEDFYSKIKTPRMQNEFLRVACSYRYLAKHGDWKVSVCGVNDVIDYLTNSYKLIAVFSLIESLSDQKHQDFYQWLTTSDQIEVFPIADRKALRQRYDEYKLTFGSIRRCVLFFSRLSSIHQESLCKSIEFEGLPIDGIKKLAQYLYELRSKFVHEAELVLQIGTPTHLLSEKGHFFVSLTVDALFEAFEAGVIAYFGEA